MEARDALSLVSTEFKNKSGGIPSGMPPLLFLKVTCNKDNSILRLIA